MSSSFGRCLPGYRAHLQFPDGSVFVKNGAHGDRGKGTMSKLPKTDATEAALSAVEEALKIDFGDVARGRDSKAETASFGKNTDRGGNTAKSEPARSRTRLAESQSAERKSAERSRARRAANDDVRSVGNLLYALQRRPSTAPFWTAFLLSAVWIGFGLMFGLGVWRADIRQLLRPPTCATHRT